MKKKFLLFLMGFITYSGFAQLDEDFESAPPTPDASGVWTMNSGNWLVRDNRTNSTPNWEINPNGLYPAHSGSKAAFVNRDVAEGILTEEWLITPQINVPANRQLRFFTRQTQAGSPTPTTFYQVRVSTDPNPSNLAAYSTLVEYTETTLSTITINQLDYEEKIIDLTLTGAHYFAFVKVYTQPGPAPTGDRWLVDDVKIIEKCPNPSNFNVDNVSAYNATITWDGPAPQYNLEYGPSGFVLGSGTIVTGIIGNEYTIPLETAPPGPLDPDTSYQFYLTAICPINAGLPTGPFTFSTAPLGSTCDAPIEVTPLPYSDAGNTLQQGNNISESSPGNNCGTNGDFLAGNDVVYSYTVPATTTGLISIDMNPLSNTNTGVFVYANCSDIGSNCIAGVANNNGGIRNIPALPVAAGQTIYIVISSNDSTPTFDYTILIQDVTCAPPASLSATGTGPNSANLSWQNPGGAASWQVFVQTAGSSVPSNPGITAGINDDFAVTQLTAEGTTLQLGTPYQYWVRADCGDGTFSQWAGPYLFNTTSCSIGCNYNFELLDSWGDGWNGNTMSVIQDGLTIATLGPTFTDGGGLTISVPLCDGPFTIFWNEGGGSFWEVGLSVTNSFGQVIFFKDFNEFSPDSEIFAGTVDCQNPMCLPPTQLSWSNVTTNGVEVAWLPNGPAPASWDIYIVEVGSDVPGPGATPVYNTPGTNTSFTFTTQLDPDTQYVFYVRAVCSTPGSNPWSDVSEPFTTIPTCPRPIALHTLNADLTSISFEWTAGGGESEWEYIFVPANSPMPADDDPLWTSTTTQSVDITTGLIQGTAYDFYVRAICSDDDISTPAGPTTGNTTICPASEQCNYAFTLTDDWGDGWNGNTMNILQNGIVVATIGEDFTDGNGPVVVQVPLCNGVPFELFWTENGFAAYEVGVSITNPFSEIIYNKPFNVGEQGTTLYTATAACAVQTCLEPTNVLVTSTSLTTATIQWVENNTPAPSSWDILILPSSAQPPAQNATGWINVNTMPYVYEDLTAATSYTVYIRTVCSDPDKSFWSIGHDLATQVCEPANVCDYTFIMTDSYGDGWNDSTMSILQNGITVATFGSEFTDGNGPVEVVLSLCNNMPFELFWNDDVQGYPVEVGIAIEDASGNQIFNHEASPDAESLLGTTLFSGTVNCIPATCPKPVQLNALNIGETSAELSWTEALNATQWEVIILPAGSPIPPPLPSPNPDGIITSDNPYTATLASGTAYVYYVRAICSDSDHSNWAGPKAFNTLITNDECDAAINIPVNPDQSCAQIVSGAIIGATASALPNDCDGTADDDVWFQFTAVTTAHNINIFNVNGSTDDLFHIVYQGDNCGNLTLVSCNDNNESIATGLTPGQVYFVRIFSWTAEPGQTSTFDICIGTIPPPISTSTISHTPQQLIEDVLLNTTCASVSNISFSTGTDFGSVNGIGYFDRNGSSFPFDYGVILTTGNADSASGPNTDILGEGNDNWPGDPDLTQVLADAGIPTGTLGNATSMEFDFVPLTNNISFDFIFASEEYGNYQCQYSDVFAFLLTNTVTNVTTNLAVVPNTDIPISVLTIRNNLYNTDCDSANEAYFGSYYGPGANPLEAPVNFNGITVPLTATSAVTPGVTYHIKLAIADYTQFEFQDNVYDSAVFLEGNSFGLGNVELGDNLLVENGNALCSEEEIVINSTLDPANYTFVWDFNGDPIDGETGPTLTVSAEGEYTVHAQLNNSTCTGTDSIVIEYYTPTAPGTGETLTLCNSLTTGVFDLTQNAPAILAPLQGDYALTYFLTEAEATTGTTGAIGSPSTYTNISNPQTIYVRATNNVTGCFGLTSFQLIIQDLTPQFTLPADFSICAGGSATIAVTPINFDLNDATYSWTLDTNPLPDVTSSIIVTQAGHYEVTVNHSGCTATSGVNVSIDSQITPVFNTIALICQNTTAPTLPTTSVNSVTGTWNPAIINTSLSGTVNYCFTPDASQTCAVSVCIDITVEPEIISSFDPIGTLCTGTTPPILTTTSLNGITGIWNPTTISTATPGNFPFEFTPNAGQNCALVYNITVEILPAGRIPVFEQLAPICSGEDLVLPTQSQNGINGVWTPSVDNAETTTYTFVPDDGQCSIETTMAVIVNPNVDSDFELVGDCVGSNKVLSVKNNSFASDVIYTWTDAQGEPISGADDPTYIATTVGTYGLTVSLGNCFASKTILVDSVSCGIQRGISPGDGSKNDFFDLSGQGVSQLEIFNRYGTKVYSQVNYQSEWYGQSDKGEELPDGTYYYVIEYSHQPSKTGWIYINRVK